MNFGKTISDLRKQKNVTQEEMAAELGVTAAAVSKWENGYTLPDILMLCAIADYFDVTTDELLGRKENLKFAVIAAETMELGQKIADLAREHGIIAHGIYSHVQKALDAVSSRPEVKLLITSLGHPLNEIEEKEIDKETNGIIHVNSEHETEEGVLAGLELYFKNMDVFKTLAGHKIHTTKNDK